MRQEEGSVKRTDLNLRIKYIGLKTEIYQIAPYSFVIHCINYKGNFEELIKDFDYSIRQFGMDVKLTDKSPIKFIKKLAGIPLSNVVNEFKASCITESDMRSFIESKFFNIDIIDIEIPQRGIGFEILIRVSEETKESEIEEMHQYLLNIDLGTDKITIVPTSDYDTENEIKMGKSEQIDDVISVMHLNVIKDLPFTISDADLWFEKAEDIYTGKMTRKDLYFFREESLKCFLDFSVFDNINLRNVLLLYDTVYIGLPIENQLVPFLEQQNMTISDLIELVDMGKVVLVLSNLETRYDHKLLLEAYKRNPCAVVSRRGLNALLAAYLTETRHQYELRYPEIYNLASAIFLEGIEQKNLKLQNIARILAWPITATAESFSILNQDSPMAIGNFGINTIITSNISNNKDNILFEFTMNAPSTHIAAALQSTYFPFKQCGNDAKIYSDSIVSNIMGDFLKLYWYDATNLQSIKHIYKKNYMENNYLKMFDFKNNIKITKVATLADDYNTPLNFRDILMRLDNMNELERKNKINEYNDILFEVAATKSNPPKDYVQFMLGSTGFLQLSHSLSVILAFIGITRDQINRSEAVQKEKELKIISRCIEESGIRANKQLVEDIYLLDKISRVAILK